MGVEGTYLNMMGATCDRSSAFMICSGKGLRAFPLGSRMGWGCPLPPRLFKILLKVLGTAIGQEKEIKGIQIGREEVKLSLCADEMILYIEDPKDPTQKLLELVNGFSRLEGYSINVLESVAFLYTSNEISEKIKKSCLKLHQKNPTKILGINLTKEVRTIKH